MLVAVTVAAPNSCTAYLTLAGAENDHNTNHGNGIARPPYSYSKYEVMMCLPLASASHAQGSPPVCALLRQHFWALASLYKHIFDGSGLSSGDGGMEDGGSQAQLAAE